MRGRYFRPIRSRSTADRDRERRSNARGERTTASTEPVRARSVPAQRTASRRSEGSEGERGCACRGGRRGAVPPGCRIANGLARRARGASSDRAGRRIPDGKRHRRTFHRGIDGDRARRSTDKRFDRETQTHARVRGASRDKAPGTGPCSVASARSPRPIARFERASGVIFPERARHVGTARYFFEQAGGARSRRAFRPEPRPRARERPRFSSKTVSARPRARRRVRRSVSSPRVPRAPRPRIFADRKTSPARTKPIVSVVHRSTFLPPR